MERLDELENHIRDYWDERIAQRKVTIEKQEPQLEHELCQKLNTLINEQLVKQAEDEQRAVKYLYLCQMKSSNYTGSYEVMLGLSNSMLYLDEDKSYTFWYPKQIYEVIDKDMEYVTTQLRKKFIRLEEYELFYLKQKLLQDDWKLLINSYINIGNTAYETIANTSLTLDTEFMIVYGDYMEQLQGFKGKEKDI